MLQGWATSGFNLIQVFLGGGKYCIFFSNSCQISSLQVFFSFPVPIPDVSVQSFECLPPVESMYMCYYKRAGLSNFGFLLVARSTYIQLHFVGLDNYMRDTQLVSNQACKTRANRASTSVPNSPTGNNNNRGSSSSSDSANSYELYRDLCGDTVHR